MSIDVKNTYEETTWNSKKKKIIKDPKSVPLVSLQITLQNPIAKEYVVVCSNNFKKKKKKKKKEKKNGLGENADRIRVTQRIDAESRVKPCHGARSAVDRRENPFRSDLICQDHSYSV